MLTEYLVFVCSGQRIIKVIARKPVDKATRWWFYGNKKYEMKYVLKNHCFFKLIEIIRMTYRNVQRRLT